VRIKNEKKNESIVLKQRCAFTDLWSEPSSCTIYDLSMLALVSETNYTLRIDIDTYRLMGTMYQRNEDTCSTLTSKTLTYIRNQQI